MTPTHGTVIVCERDHGATVAWVEPELSEMMPEGYFVEIWHRPWVNASKCDVVRTGTMAGGYVIGLHSDAGEAVRWCWQDRKRRERERKAA